MTRFGRKNPDLHTAPLGSSDTATERRSFVGSLHMEPAARKEQATKFLGPARGAFNGPAADFGPFRLIRVPVIEPCVLDARMMVLRKTPDELLGRSLATQHCALDEWHG